MTMGTGKTIEQFGIDDVSGGCNYSDDVMAVTKNQSPDSMNVDFTNGRIRKRGGTEVWTSLGSLYDADLEYDVDQEYNGGVSNATAVGFSLVDFSDYNIADDQTGPSIAQSTHLKFDLGQTAFRIVKYIDGQNESVAPLIMAYGDATNSLSPVVQFKATA
jgi:hypothetical protein